MKVSGHPCLGDHPLPCLLGVHCLCSSPLSVVKLFWCQGEGIRWGCTMSSRIFRDTLGALWCVNRGETLYIYLRFTPVYRYTSYCLRWPCIPTSYTHLTIRYTTGKLVTSQVALYPPPIHTWYTCFPLEACIQHNFKGIKQLLGCMNRKYIIIDMFILRNETIYY